MKERETPSDRDGNALLEVCILLFPLLFLFIPFSSPSPFTVFRVAYNSTKLVSCVCVSFLYQFSLHIPVKSKEGKRKKEEEEIVEKRAKEKSLLLHSPFIQSFFPSLIRLYTIFLFISPAFAMKALLHKNYIAAKIVHLSPQLSHSHFAFSSFRLPQESNQSQNSSFHLSLHPHSNATVYE